jgi:hypothetical protein
MALNRLQRLLAGVQQQAAADATSKMQAANQKATEAETKAAAAETKATTAETKATTASTMASATPSRVRNPRIPVPAITAGAAPSIAVTWSPAFPSANYTLARPLLIGTNLTLEVAVSNPTATGCTLTVKNVSLTNLLSSVASIHLLAIHDPLT